MTWKKGGFDQETGKGTGVRGSSSEDLQEVLSLL